MHHVIDLLCNLSKQADCHLLGRVMQLADPMHPSSGINATILYVVIQCFNIACTIIFDAIVIPFFRSGNYRLLLALSDGFCHGFTSLCTFHSFYLMYLKRIPPIPWTNIPILLYYLLVPFLMGCCIDLDHFIAARSLRLIDATSLPSRPFGHCIAYDTIIIICIFYLLADRSAKFMVLSAVTVFNHLTRDSTRRGYWIIPGDFADQLTGLSHGSTPPIPYALHLMIIISTPWLASKIYDCAISSSHRNTQHKDDEDDLGRYRQRHTSFNALEALEV